MRYAILSTLFYSVQMATRITELANELTANIDSVGAVVGIATLAMLSSSQTLVVWLRDTKRGCG